MAPRTGANARLYPSSAAAARGRLSVASRLLRLPHRVVCDPAMLSGIRAGARYLALPRVLRVALVQRIVLTAAQERGGRRAVRDPGARPSARDRRRGGGACAPPCSRCSASSSCAPRRGHPRSTSPGRSRRTMTSAGWSPSTRPIPGRRMPRPCATASCSASPRRSRSARTRCSSSSPTITASVSRIPIPSGSGEVVSTSFAEALAGEEVVEWETGTLGESARAKVPVYPRDGGSPVGEVSVGFARASVFDELPAVVVGIARRRRRRARHRRARGTAPAPAVERLTLGLQPEELVGLVQNQAAVLDGVGDGVIALDAAGVVRVCNERAERMLGLDATRSAARSRPARRCPAALLEAVAGARRAATASSSGERVLYLDSHAVVHDGRTLGDRARPPRPHRPRSPSRERLETVRAMTERTARAAARVRQPAACRRRADRRAACRGGAGVPRRAARARAGRLPRGRPRARRRIPAPVLPRREGDGGGRAGRRAAHRGGHAAARHARRGGGRRARSLGQSARQRVHAPPCAARAPARSRWRCSTTATRWR